MKSKDGKYFGGIFGIYILRYLVTQLQNIQEMRVMNDPLGQNHSNNHYSCLNFVLFCEILKNEGRSDKYSDHYQLWLWVGRVDQ